MATEPSLGPGRQPRLENSGASSTLTSGSAFRGASAPGTLTSGSAFRTPQPFGKNNTPIAASVEAQKAKEAEEARTYKVSPLSDDEWSKLTTSQQRAVAGNQLLYKASQDSSAREVIHSFLGYDDKNPAPEDYSFATMNDIRRFGNFTPASTAEGDVFIPVEGSKATMTAPQEKTFKDLSMLVARYSKRHRGSYSKDYSSMDLDSILTGGGSSVAKYLGRKSLSIEDESQKLDPLIDKIARASWSEATPDDIKSLEGTIRSTTEGMPLDQALAYMRKQFIKLGELNEDFDPQPIIQFLNIGGGNGSQPE